MSSHQSSAAVEGDANHVPPANAEEIAKQMKSFAKIGLAQFVVTLITVGVSCINFGSMGLKIAAVLVCALANAGVVTVFSMHLLKERNLIHRVVVFTVIFLVALIVLSGMHYADLIPGLKR